MTAPIIDFAAARARKSPDHGLKDFGREVATQALTGPTGAVIRAYEKMEAMGASPELKPYEQRHFATLIRDHVMTALQQKKENGLASAQRMNINSAITNIDIAYREYCSNIEGTEPTSQNDGGYVIAHG